MKALILILLATLAIAEDEVNQLPEDFVPNKDNISEKYYAGAFLIYDCEEMHFVCVLPEDHQTCVKNREEAIRKKEKNLPCAPIGEFPTKRSCFQRELYLVGQAHGNRFCLLDELKKEEID